MRHPNPEAAARVARSSLHFLASDEGRDLQDLAAEEAARHEEWADGLTPDEYQLALVDRAQARKHPRKDTPDE